MFEKTKTRVLQPVKDATMVALTALALALAAFLIAVFR